MFVFKLLKKSITFLKHIIDLGEEYGKVVMQWVNSIGL
jgi:hypothetical protein